jgi:hypothetical protein
MGMMSALVCFLTSFFFYSYGQASMEGNIPTSLRRILGAGLRLNLERHNPSTFSICITEISNGGTLLIVLLVLYSYPAGRVVVISPLYIS